MSRKKATGMSMEVIVTIVSELGYFTYLRDLQPTFIGVIVHLLSTMDIPIPSYARMSQEKHSEHVILFGKKTYKVS